MKNLATIGILIIFVFDSIIMPYGNFDDNYATRLLYNQQQENDPNLSLTEFIFEKLLCMSDPFEDEDEDDADLAHSLSKNPQPIQSLQIQAGFFECCKLVLKLKEFPETVAKPTCSFKENKFSREFPTAIFHPPAIVC